MMKNTLNQWFCGVCLLLVLLKVDGFPVPMTLLESDVAKGAVCLDGSAPGYHFVKGSGAGANNWVVHLEGGAWCSTIKDCAFRATQPLGSTKNVTEPAYFNGILNNGSDANPDFYNWNRIKVRYCDGSSYLSDIEEVDPKTNLHFRGARIFKAVVEHFLSMGMKDAERVVLTGCSAGSLGVILNCDRFKSMLPSNINNVKCVADGGYFANIKAMNGVMEVEAYYDEVVSFHKLAKNLPESCTSKMEKASLCYFPENVVPDIKTPIFFVNPSYDLWQIGVNYVSGKDDPKDLWKKCKDDLKKCSADQLKSLQKFNAEFLDSFKKGVKNPSTGFFVNSCYTHCQIDVQETWLKAGSPEINGKTMAAAVGDWVYDRSPPFQGYGIPYPFDKTCVNFVKPPNATKSF